MRQVSPCPPPLPPPSLPPSADAHPMRSTCHAARFARPRSAQAAPEFSLSADFEPELRRACLHS